MEGFFFLFLFFSISFFGDKPALQMIVTQGIVYPVVEYRAQLPGERAALQCNFPEMLEENI